MRTMKLITILFATHFLANTGLALELPGPLVETDWLAKNLKKVTILDVRKDVKSFTKKPIFTLDVKTNKLTLQKVGSFNFKNSMGLQKKRSGDTTKLTFGTQI